VKRSRTWVELQRVFCALASTLVWLLSTLICAFLGLLLLWMLVLLGFKTSPEDETGMASAVFVMLVGGFVGCVLGIFWAFSTFYALVRRFKLPKKA